MAEGSSATYKAYAAAALWFQAGADGARPLYLCLDKGDMAAFDETTDAPASEATESGLTRTAATLTIEDSSEDYNDICRCYHLWTAGASASITGAESMTAVANGDHMMGWHRYADTIPLQSGDTLAETMDFQFKAG